MIKLRALELGLGIPEDNLIAAAQGKLPQTDAAKNEAKLLGVLHALTITPGAVAQGGGWRDWCRRPNG